MVNLSPHILTLLERNECVIMPCFGAFVLQRRSARFEGKLLLPPHTGITFNPAICDADGMLAHHLSTNLNISYSVACEQVHSVVSYWKSSISQRRDVVIDGVGTFSAGDDGTILFTPMQAYAFADNYGLKPLCPLPYAHIAADVEENVVVQESAQTPNMPRKNTWFRVAAAAVIAFFLWSVMPTDVIDMPAGNDMLTSVDWSYLRDKKIEEEKAMEDSIAAHYEAIQNMTYHLVVASLAPVAADEYCGLMMAQGFQNAHTVPGSNGLNRVAIDAYDDFKQALAELKEIRKNPAFARAWVMTKR